MIKNILFISVVLFMTSCSEQNNIKTPQINAEFAFSMVEKIISFSPRPSGHINNAKTAAFIAKTAGKWQNNSVFIQKWNQSTVNGNITFNNVIVEIIGEQDEFIVIGSHFDTKILPALPDFSGANDGGSSTGLLLALIKTICESNIKPQYTLRFIFFDGEECFMQYSDSDGLYGSRYYVETLKKNNELKLCKATIILDMIGDKDLGITLPLGNDKNLAKLLFKSANSCNSKKYFNWADIDIMDDHTPFLKAGIPAIDIIDFKYGPSNCYWHTKEDTIDKISVESLEIVGKVTLKLIYSIE